MTHAFKSTNKMSIPGCCEMMISYSNMLTVMGAISKTANALVARTTIRTASIEKVNKITRITLHRWHDQKT